MNHTTTTILGILTIIGGVAAAAVAFLSGHFDAAAMTTLGGAITAGLGLIKAADASKVVTRPS